jgi:hypothetical protein
MVRVPFAITLHNCSILEGDRPDVDDHQLSGFVGQLYRSHPWPFANLADRLALGNGFHAAGQTWVRAFIH